MWVRLSLKVEDLPRKNNKFNDEMDVKTGQQGWFSKHV